MNKKLSFASHALLLCMVYTPYLLCMNTGHPPSYEMQEIPPDYTEEEAYQTTTQHQFAQSSTMPNPPGTFDAGTALRYIQHAEDLCFRQMMHTVTTLDADSYQTLHTAITTRLTQAMRKKNNIERVGGVLFCGGLISVGYGIFALGINSINPDSCATDHSNTYYLNTIGQFLGTVVPGSALLIDGARKTYSLDYTIASRKVTNLTQMKAVLESTSHSSAQDV
ncbi:MAG: hypothetical protein WCE21_02135 [Candidatus Babeliales bacterium]